jgi:nucleotide-binding universal stress UspA family protein
VLDKPAAGILKVAQEQSIDLVIMGSHGAGGITGRDFFGTTTYQVARKLSCSVMIIKSSNDT